jgi:very-short-patch-repair endonuclease
MREIIKYKPILKEYARANRKAGNLSEALLWLELKNKKLNGLDFDRQTPIGSYIADFYCKDKKVVIEIDGWSHDDKYWYDRKRDNLMIDAGIVVIRIDDIDVKKQMNKVLYMLENHPRLQP